MATSPYFSTSNQYIKYDIHVDEVSTSIANNTSYIHVYVLVWRTNSGYTTSGTGTCYCTINGTSYSQSITSSQTIYHNSDTRIFDKYVTIPHNADGSKTIYVSSYISHARFSSSSQGFNVTLTKIPRKADFTNAPNFTDEDDPVISYTNPAGSAADSIEACISLDGTTDTVAYRSIPLDGTSYQFTLTASDRSTLLAATPNSNSLTVHFLLKTVLGGTTYYSDAERTMSVVNAAPVLGAITYEDIEPTTVAITGDDQKIIQDHSDLQFSISKLEAVKSATLDNIEIVINEVTFTDSLSGSVVNSYTADFGTVNSSQDETATIRLTDSRGNVAVAQVPVTVLEWYVPSALTNLRRVSNFYDETDLTVNADYASLDGNNVVTITYEYRESGSGPYSAPVSMNDGDTVQIVLDNTKEWDVRVVVSDLFDSTTYNLTIGIGIPILFIDRKRRSVGVGAIPDQDNMLVADRRISLKNPLHETVLDLWSTNSGGTRAAMIAVKDQNGTTLTDIYGSQYGGSIGLYNTDNNPSAFLWTGGNKDGVLDLYDDSGNKTIGAVGKTGIVSATRFKASGQVVELFSGTLTSGSQTFSGDYSMYIFVGRVSSSGSATSITLPRMIVTSSSQNFYISNELGWVTFSLVESGDDVQVAIQSRSGDGYLMKIYGI